MYLEYPVELLVLLSINMVIDLLSSDVVINWKNILYRWEFDSIINERKITPKREIVFR